MQLNLVLPKKDDRKGKKETHRWERVTCFSNKGRNAGLNTPAELFSVCWDKEDVAGKGGSGSLTALLQHFQRLAHYLSDLKRHEAPKVSR